MPRIGPVRASTPPSAGRPCFAVGSRIIGDRVALCITKQNPNAVSVAGNLWNHLKGALIKYQIDWFGDYRNGGAGCCIARFHFVRDRIRIRIHFLQQQSSEQDNARFLAMLAMMKS